MYLFQITKYNQLVLWGEIQRSEFSSHGMYPCPATRMLNKEYSSGGLFEELKVNSQLLGFSCPKASL